MMFNIVSIVKLNEFVGRTDYTIVYWLKIKYVYLV